MTRAVVLLLVMLMQSGVGAFAQSTASPGSIEETARKHLAEWRASRTGLADDWGELGRYREENQKLLAQPFDKNRVVFFGDSITDIWPIAKSFPGKPYVNRGIGGQTTSQMLVRFQQDVIALKPRAVVILAGTNDIAGNTGPIRDEDIEANFASMAELAHARGIHVLIASITPVHNYTAASQEYFSTRPQARILTLNKWLKAYCAKRGIPYLDYYSAMVDGSGMLRRELADDGLHPNADGYAIMNRMVSEALSKPAPKRK